MVLEEQSHSDNSDNDEPAIQIPKKRKGRSATQCQKLTKLPDGERKIVTYNAKGQPIGESKCSLSSWTGMLAKSRVRIIYKNWRAVPDGVKDQLWKSIKDERDARLSAVYSAWIKFKSTLTTKYIRPFEDEPEKLQKPPEIYKKFISQDDWVVFLVQRLSDEFQELSLKQSARRKKKVYNHRISKKEYAGLAEELKAKLGPSFDENDRAFMWKIAHQDSKGLHPDEATQKVAEKIDILKDEVKEGKIKTQGRNDVLTMALGTPEHNGRVRAVGEGVTPTVYFHLTRFGSRKHINELESSLRDEHERRKEEEAKRKEEEMKRKNMEKKCQELEDKIKKLETGSGTPPTGAKVASNSNKSDNRLHISLSKDEDQVHKRSNKPIKINNKAAKTRLLLEKLKLNAERKNASRNHVPLSKNGPILGKAKKCSLAVDVIYKIVAKGMVYEELGPETKVHNVPLGPNNLRVSVDEVIFGNALLPVPVGDELVFVKDALGSQVGWPKEFVLTDEEVTSTRKPLEKDTYNKEKMNKQGKGHKARSNEQSSIKAFLEFLHLILPNDKVDIKYTIRIEVFREDIEFSYLPKCDLVDLCKMNDLEASILIAYMSCLYEKFQSSQDPFRFINPLSFSRPQGSDKSKFLLAQLQKVEGKEFIFLPHNPGNHWVLIVIVLKHMDIYYLDSLHWEPTEDFKIFINNGLILYKRLQGLRNQQITWESIKVKAFVEKKNYTHAEIDELRLELLDLFSEL